MYVITDGLYQSAFVTTGMGEKKDPRRPIPTSTFKNQRTLKLGTMTVELKKGQWHSPGGDLLAYDFDVLV